MIVTDDEVKTNLSINVRRLLESRGWSGRDLARICRESQPTISRLLNGEHVPKLGTVTRIAAALQTSVDYLLADHRADGPLVVTEEFATSA